MKFHIVGASAESGEDVDVTIEATDQKEVEKIAHDKGILVSAIDSPAESDSEGTAIALVIDDTPTEGHVGAAVGGNHPVAHAPAHPAGHAPAHPAGDPHAHPPGHDAHGHGPEHHKSGITLSANAPSELSHNADDDKSHSAHTDQKTEYHLLMNQALYLLEVAVNKHLKDGWECQGGLTIGMSNNAMQYFQAMIRKKK